MDRTRPYFLLVLSTVLISLFFLFPQTASAHRMLIEHEDAGVILISYDDGTPAGLALVTAYDANGDILFEQESNDDGILNYDRELDIYRIIADDGMGHRATWTGQEEASMLDDIPVYVRALFGISILLFIAAIFFLRADRKSRGGENNK